jgi:hypothetical protein
MEHTGMCSETKDINALTITNHSDSQLILKTTVSAKTPHTELKLSHLPQASTVETSSNIMKLESSTWKLSEGDGDGEMYIYINKSEEHNTSVAGEGWVYFKKPKLTVLHIGPTMFSCTSKKEIESQSDTSYITPGKNFVFASVNGSYQPYTAKLYNNENLTTYIPSQTTFSKDKLKAVQTHYFTLSQIHDVDCIRDIELTPVPSTNSHILGKTYSLDSSSSIWVLSKLPLTSHQSTWTHEYIHTRQCYILSESLEWFSEGSATYYTARYQENLKEKSFLVGNTSQFFAANYTGSSLEKPQNWAYKTEYNRGAKLSLYIDYHLQEKGFSLKKLSRWMNSKESRLQEEQFYTYIKERTSPKIAQKIKLYTQTNAQIPFKKKYLTDTANPYKMQATQKRSD